MSSQFSNINDDRLSCKICYTTAFDKTSYQAVLCAGCHYLYCSSCFKLLNNICSYCKSSSYYILDTRKSELQYLLGLDTTTNEFITILQATLDGDKPKFKDILSNLRIKFFEEFQTGKNIDLRTLMRCTIDSLRDIKIKLNEEITVYQKNKKELERERALVEASLNGFEERETRVKEGEKELRQLDFRERTLREKEEIFQVQQNSLETHEKELKNREANLELLQQKIELQKIKLIDIECKEKDLNDRVANYNRYVEEYHKINNDLKKRLSTQAQAEKCLTDYNKKLEVKEAELKFKEDYLEKTYLDDKYQEIDTIKKELADEKSELDKYRDELDKYKSQLNIQKLELDKKETENQAYKLQLENDRNYFDTYYFVFKQQELEEKTKKINVQIEEINITRAQLHHEVIELAKAKLLVYDMYCKMRTKKVKEEISLTDSQKEILEESGKIVEKLKSLEETPDDKYDPISTV